MGRMIDANRLLLKFKEKSNNPNYRMNMHNIWSYINTAPTVEERKQGEWIPVNEILPKEETDVLICTDCGDIDVSRRLTYSDGTWEWFTSTWIYGEVIAWMPLPEPYIESEKTDDSN